MTAFEKIAENTKRQEMRDQFAKFHMRKGMYAHKDAQTDQVKFDPITWLSYGSGTPEWGSYQGTSISSAEINWSTYKYIHSVARNRLHRSRAEILFPSTRTLSLVSLRIIRGDFRNWDINTDNPMLEENAMRLKEVSWDTFDVDNNGDVIMLRTLKRLWINSLAITSGSYFLLYWLVLLVLCWNLHVEVEVFVLN